MKIKKEIRKYLSRKYLDWAEKLPKINSGTISELQQIRKLQKSLSKTFNSGNEKPKKAKLSLKTIRIVISFQLEEFHIIEQALNNLFPDNERISKFINNLKENSSSIHASSWNELGVIVNSDSGIVLSRTKLIDVLPKHTEYIQVSHHRIMPSLACLSFTFQVENQFSQELEKLQKKEKLPEIIFKNLNPFRTFFSYSMSGDTEIINGLRGHISDYVSILEKWIKSRINLKTEPAIPISVIEYFEYNKKIKEKNKWVVKNRGWLSCYGISVMDRAFWDSNSILCTASYPKTKLPVYIVTSFKNNIKPKDSQAFNLKLKLDALSVLSAINASLNLIQNVLRKHRKLGFQNLAMHETKILKQSKSINALKRVGTLLKRFELEFEESKKSFLFLLEGINELTRKDYHGSEQTLIQSEYNNISFKTSALRKALDIVDRGLTDYLEVQNIYAMYKLQKWMFILSIVVTLATIISLLSSWDEINKLWNSLCAFFTITKS